MIKKFLFFILFIPITSFCQIKISGKIIDKNTKQKLAYVDVFTKLSDSYSQTNIDGTFYLENNLNIDTLIVNYDSYISKKIPFNKGNFYNYVIELEPEPTKMSEVVVNTKIKKYKNKKENPAYKILKEIWNRKKNNGLKLADTYKYEEYEKIQFDLNNIDSTFTNKKIFRKMEFIFNNIDTSTVSGKSFLPLFINESISNVTGQNNPTKREKIELIANKTSGFQDNEIVSYSVKNLYKNYDIYDDRMNFFDKNFVSPIAKDGFNHYEYQLMDSVSVDQIPCYRIKFYPKRTGELTFKGSFYVTKDNYSIKEVTLATTKGINVNFVRDIYVELSYDSINDSIFLPKKVYTLLDMSLFNKKNDSKGMFAHRTLSFRNYKINEKLNDDAFKQVKLDITLEAYKKDDQFWKYSRHDKLAKNEEQIYVTLDSLQKVPKFKNMIKLSETIVSGYFNIGNFFDFGSIYSLIGKNDIEGYRLRLGGRTYFSQNDLWRLNFYTAYGFKDEKVKYAAELRNMINKNNRWIIGIGNKKDIEQLGGQLTTAEGIISRASASSALFARGNNTTLSNIEKTNVFTTIEPIKNFQIRIDGTFQKIESAFENFKINYLDQNNLEQSITNDTHISASITWRPKAKFSLYGLDRYEHSSLSPTFLLKYDRGIKGILNSDFNYNKFQFYYFQPLLIGSLGKLDARLEIGKSLEALPISLLSTIPGNQSYSIVPNVFSQINYYEFITDTYSTLMLEHHFNGRILGYVPIIKKLKLREVIFFKSAWGTISDKTKNINASSIIYNAPDKDIYYEYGFGIENIGIGNFKMFRFDFNWRGNYLDNPNVQKFGFKFGYSFSF